MVLATQHTLQQSRKHSQAPPLPVHCYSDYHGCGRLSARSMELTEGRYQAEEEDIFDYLHEASTEAVRNRQLSKASTALCIAPGVAWV